MNLEETRHLFASKPSDLQPFRREQSADFGFEDEDPGDGLQDVENVAPGRAEGSTGTLPLDGAPVDSRASEGLSGEP